MRPTWNELRERVERIKKLEQPTEFNEGECPKCGWDSIDGDPENCIYSNHQRDNAAEIVGSAGAPAYFWTETWTCPKCSTKFSFENSNY